MPNVNTSESNCKVIEDPIHMALRRMRQLQHMYIQEARKNPLPVAHTNWIERREHNQNDWN
jgi:hypothetical protein